jgi:RNA polymerase sigma-70 factor (ECF subfamily)
MDDKEFENIFREHFTPLTNLAYTVVKDADVAKDVVQQVFLKFWQIRDETTIQHSIKSYLYRAVVNTSLNHVAKDKRFTSLESQKVEPVNDAEDLLHTEQTKNTIDSKVRAAIDELSPTCREVFQLSRFSDLTNKEIAGQLNISVKAVEKHISKALKILREKLKPLLSVETMLWYFLAIKLFYFQVGFFYITLSL